MKRFIYMLTLCVLAIFEICVINACSSKSIKESNSNIQNNEEIAEPIIERCNNQTMKGDLVVEYIKKYSSEYSIILRNTAFAKAGMYEGCGLNFGYLIFDIQEMNNEAFNCDENDKWYEVNISEDHISSWGISKHKEDTVYEARLALDKDTEKPILNTYIEGLNSRGLPQFIRSTALYHAYHIQDAKGNLIGFFFDQIA